MRCISLLYVFLFVCSPDVRADLDDETIEEVKKLGGTAKVDKALDEIARVSALFETMNDATLEKLVKFGNIGALTISDATKVTERGFSALKELPDLQRLSLSKCTLNDKTVAAIGSIRTIDTLSLSGAKLTDALLANMKKLTNLKNLDLMDTPITDAGLKTILGFTKLQELNLSGTKVTDAGILTLKALEKLSLLRLNRTNVTRKAIDALEEARGKGLTVRF